MPANEPEFPPDAVRQAAAEWAARRDRGLTVRETEAFLRWHAEPRNAAEFARVSAGLRKLEQLAGVSAMASEADAIVAAAKRRRAGRRSVRTGFAMLAAAAVIALAFVAFRPAADREPESYRVIASTSREMLLPDRSVALLNGDTRVETDFTANARRVSLVSGEALFTVAKDPSRPFLVTVGPVTVRAVGTVFNIRRSTQAVEVLVTEGIVRVEDSAAGHSLLPSETDGDVVFSMEDSVPVITAGNRATVNLSASKDESSLAEVERVTPAQIESALMWQSTRLVFDETPLAVVVAAFNRCNEQQVTLGDASLRSHRITGSFRADNLDGFTRLLRAGLGVTAQRQGEVLVLAHEH